MDIRQIANRLGELLPADWAVESDGNVVLLASRFESAELKLSDAQAFLFRFEELAAEGPFTDGNVWNQVPHYCMT